MKVVDSTKTRGHPGPGGRVSRILLDHESGLQVASVIQVDFPEGGASEYHTRPESTEIIYSLKGENAIGLPGGERVLLPEGSVTAIPPRTEHRHENAGPGPSTILAIFIPPGQLTDAIRKRPLEG